MRFIAVIHGLGYGCGQTIGCNLNTTIIEADGMVEAKKKARLFIEEWYEDPGAKPIDQRVEYVDVYELGKQQGRVRLHRAP